MRNRYERLNWWSAPRLECDLQDPHDPAAQPVQRPAVAAHGKRRRLHDGPPQIAGRRRPHAKLVARNRAVLANLQPTCSTRAFRTVPPQELTDTAHKAARLIDTQYDATLRTYRSNEHFDVSLTALGPQLGMKVHS